MFPHTAYIGFVHSYRQHFLYRSWRTPKTIETKTQNTNNVRHRHWEPATVKMNNFFPENADNNDDGPGNRCADDAMFSRP